MTGHRGFGIFTIAVLNVGVAVASPLAGVEAGAPLSADELRIVAVDARSRPDVDVVVAVPATVRGRTFDQSAFTVTVDGRPVATTVEPLPADSLTVVLVVDNAAGVDGATFLAEQGAAVEFVLQLDPRTPLVV